ncbi:MAG: hypothetical protein ABEI06_00520 [Halobacteriaceae archaeon]
MEKYSFDSLLEYLHETFDSDLRWVANYNAQSYDYKFHHIRADLKNELTGNQLDYVIHRSLAVYNKRHAEEVYFHLGESDFLLVHYDKGSAYHIFLDDRRGVTIMVEPDVTVSVPKFIERCREKIESV